MCPFSGSNDPTGGLRIVDDLAGATPRMSAQKTLTETRSTRGVELVESHGPVVDALSVHSVSRRTVYGTPSTVSVRSTSPSGRLVKLAWRTSSISWLARLAPMLRLRLFRARLRPPSIVSARPAPEDREHRHRDHELDQREPAFGRSGIDASSASESLHAVIPDVSPSLPPISAARHREPLEAHQERSSRARLG